MTVFLCRVPRLRVQVESIGERLRVLRAQTKAREDELVDHRRRTFS